MLSHFFLATSDSHFFFSPPRWLIGTANWDGYHYYQAQLKRGTTPPKRVLIFDTKQSDLPSDCWNFEECKVLLHCHRFQVQSGSEKVAPDRVLSMVQIELFDI